ncbi:MAG: C-terminal binding protein [Anaerolineae bacterium]|nr:C-terminal binding protein [Anaerolineae bacterium]
MSSQVSYRVLVTDYVWPSLDMERETLARVDAELLVAPTGQEAELRALAPEADAILTCFKRVSAETIAAAPRCLVISRYGVGVDNMDVAAATAHGIVVTNVPDYCVDEVSDHTLALLLCAARRVMVYDRSVRDGAWDARIAMPIPRLRGLTLGIIGYGRIGRAVARKAAAFGLQILVSDPGTTAEEAEREGVAVADMDTLLREADFVTLHAPLTAATQNLLGEEAVRKMKPTAWLVNTARGGLVDTAALAAALREGRLGGAALDVLPQEPLPAGDPLRLLPNVILTPHVAFYSEGSLQELEAKAAEHVAQVLRGEVPTNVVNPAVLRQANLRLRARATSQHNAIGVTYG